MATTMYAPAALVEAPTRTPVPFGIGSVVIWRSGRFETGVEWEADTCDDVGGIGPAACDPSTTLGLPKDLAENGGGIGTAEPFTVYGHFTCNIVGSGGVQEAERKATAHLLAREEAAVERAFWTGALDNTPNLAGVNMTEAPVVLGLALDADAALGALEGWIGENLGYQGVIHVPRFLIPELANGNKIEARGNRLTTILGTPIVAGSGYPGTAPGVALPDATGRYMYATGPLLGYRSEVFYPSSRPGDLLDRSNNTLYAVAERSYLLGFDPCGVAAVEVAP